MDQEHMDMTAHMMAQAGGCTEEQQQFVLLFWIKTRDQELTEKLMEELAGKDRNSDAVMQKYSVMIGEKPAWTARIEELLASIEFYRIQEAAALRRLSELLAAYGVVAGEKEEKQEAPVSKGTLRNASL